MFGAEDELQHQIQQLKLVIEELKKDHATTKDTLNRVRADRDHYKKLAASRLKTIEQINAGLNGAG